MKKAIVIGGSGKVGMYLIPLLVQNNYNVINISRGKTKPFIASKEWDFVTQIHLERKSSNFEDEIAKLKPDIVLDMICFENDDMVRLINAIRPTVSHYLVTGSVWMHGRTSSIPVLEHECREPLEHYGEQKSLMDRTLSLEFKSNGFPGTAIHPGHIVCPGDLPINPQGCKSLDAFNKLKAGETLYLPNFGMETLHHVHAADVAGLFLAALKAGKPSFGEGFHAVSPRAVSFYGYAQEVASWFGKKADLQFEPYDEWKKRVSPNEAAQTLSHMLHSPSYSAQKAKEVLSFSPKYTSYEAVRECIASFGIK